jgi:hypothetical protein
MAASRAGLTVEMWASLMVSTMAGSKAVVWAAKMALTRAAMMADRLAV